MSSWVCGDNWAGAGTESQGQADMIQSSDYVSLLSSSELTHLAPDTSHLVGISFDPTRHLFSTELLLIFPVSSLTLWSSLVELSFPLLRPWISLEKPHQ